VKFGTGRKVNDSQKVAS